MRPTVRKVPRALTVSDYSRAEQLMPYSIDRLLLHTVETPTWLPSGKLWYRTRTARGVSLVLVDPVRNHQQVIATEEQLARALKRAAAGPSSISDLPFEDLELAGDEKSISFRLESRLWHYDIPGSLCVELPMPAADVARSPDKRKEAFVRDSNLWMRELSTGMETRLTTDGVRDFGYATDNSGVRHTDRPIVLWSPDSRRIATFQQDQRGVGEMYLVRTQRGHPSLETWKYPMPGDAVLPSIHRVIIDLDTRRVVRLKMPPDLIRSASWLGLACERSETLEAQWSADASQLAFISISRDHKLATFRIADCTTGDVRDVVQEQATTFYEAALSYWHAARADGAPNWRYLDASGLLVWYSSRDDWSHLYLYDVASGKLEHQITSGNWNVVSLLRVDQSERTIYFMGIGREAGRHPYFESLYRVRFDGSGLELLTPEDATHAISMSPSGEYFVDICSTPQVPPVAAVKDRDGILVRTLEKADVSRLDAVGWRPPIAITVKARDGLTDLHGLLFRPSNFDASGKYPIVNAVYSAPILGSVIPDLGRHLQWGAFSATHGLLGDARSLAELGFIVVMIDGTGTPLRSRSFHEAHYGNYGDASLPDQVAAMKQLADCHSWINLDRAGIYGISAGGYAAARAMLVFPEFFKVGVSIAGNHDPRSYQDEYCEKFIGPRELAANGTCNYDREANMALAANLKGRLMLVHGTLDDNVSPHQTLLLADALIRANRNFDLLMLPNQTHATDVGVVGRYMVRRLWDYFVLHLLNTEPPKEYQMCLPHESTPQKPTAARSRRLVAER